MGIDDMIAKTEERLKRKELVKEERTKEKLQEQMHEQKKADLRRAFEARGEDFDEMLKHVKGTLEAMHKEGSVRVGRKYPDE